MGLALYRAATIRLNSRRWNIVLPLGTSIFHDHVRYRRQPSNWLCLRVLCCIYIEIADKLRGQDRGLLSRHRRLTETGRAVSRLRSVPFIRRHRNPYRDDAGGRDDAGIMRLGWWARHNRRGSWEACFL